MRALTVKRAPGVVVATVVMTALFVLAGGLGSVTADSRTCKNNPNCVAVSTTSSTPAVTITRTDSVTTTSTTTSTATDTSSTTTTETSTSYTTVTTGTIVTITFTQTESSLSLLDACGNLSGWRTGPCFPPGP